MRCRRLIKVNKPWPIFTGQCLVILGLMYGLGWWFSSHYKVGIAHGKPCLPGKIYLIEKGLDPEVSRGDLIVFHTDERTLPYYQPGSEFVKVVQGVPGDHVEIDPAGKVQISGKDYHFETVLEPQVMQLMGKKPVDFQADYPIMPGCYFVMGTLADSYDSRYWGLVCGQQVFGKALPMMDFWKYLLMATTGLTIY